MSSPKSGPRAHEGLRQQFLAGVQHGEHSRLLVASAKIAGKGNSHAAAGLYAQSSELLLQLLQSALLRRPGGLIEPA